MTQPRVMITAVFDEINNVILIESQGGGVTTATIQQAVSNALALSERHGCNFLLFDITHMHESQPLLQGFLDMQDMGKSFGLTPFHFCAVAYDPHSYSEERAQFIENVVVNRPNPLFKMCKSKEDALKWLASKKVVAQVEEF